MPFMKGKSGNPGGKPEQKPITDALRLAVKQNDAKALNTMIRNVVSQAMAGTPWAVEFVTDRLEGRTVQQIEAHNRNEHVFAEVPETMSREQWDLLTGVQSGKPKSARNGH